MIFCVLGVPETNFHIRFENFTQKKQRSTGRDAKKDTGKVPQGNGVQTARKDGDNDENASQTGSGQHVQADVGGNNNEDNKVESNIIQKYIQKSQMSRSGGGTSPADSAQHADDNDDNNRDEEEDPNLTELQMVPFQGHPFIILPNDLTYCCKYGKDCDIQYRRKKQQNAQVPGLQKSDHSVCWQDLRKQTERFLHDQDLVYSSIALYISMT